MQLARGCAESDIIRASDAPTPPVVPASGPASGAGAAPRWLRTGAEGLAVLAAVVVAVAINSALDRLWQPDAAEVSALVFLMTATIVLLLALGRDGPDAAPARRSAFVVAVCAAGVSLVALVAGLLTGVQPVPASLYPLLVLTSSAASLASRGLPPKARWLAGRRVRAGRGIVTLADGAGQTAADGAGIPTFARPRPERAPTGGAAKRLVDILGASAGLVLLAPLLLLVALAIRLDSPGPIFFRQARGGRFGRPFRIWKFRTMRVVEDGPSVIQATRGDARVTAVGALLRRSSIDELPQLLNVLAGEMSLVGPRPHALAHDAHYAALIADYANRFHAKPGLTGWAQVNGRRGETAQLADMEDRVRYDLWYIKHRTFWLDIVILINTLVSMQSHRSAY